MRAPKWLTIITFGSSIFALLGVLKFYDNPSLSLAYDICLAFFGSALLGFIISLVEYFATKREKMENFYIKSMNSILVLSEALYFSTEEPTVLVLNCIDEELHNKYAAAAYEPLEHKSKNALVEHYKKSLPLKVVNGADFHEISEKWYAERMQTYYNDLEKCFDSYIAISNMQLGELDNAFGGLDFICANKKIRNVAYIKIYEPIRLLAESAKNRAFHFKLCKSGEGNIAVCTRFLLELNNEWFITKENDTENTHITEIYSKICNEIWDAAEEFRCKIYNQKYNPVEHKYIRMVVIPKNSNETK